MLAVRASTRRLLFAASVGVVAALVAVPPRHEEYVEPKPAQFRTLHVKLKTASAKAHFAAMHTAGTVDGELVGMLFAPTTGEDVRGHWVQVKVPKDRIDQSVADLQAEADVLSVVLPPVTTYASEMDVDTSLITTTDDSCPIKTPCFDELQGYLRPAPEGIGAAAGWVRGLRGDGVWFADIEGGWNAQHEDIPGERVTHVGGRNMTDPAWRAHGTAVLGEVVGRDNGVGVMGIAPEVSRVFTSSIMGSNVATAIDTAARNLRPGDVLLIELQSNGPRGRWIPVEYWDDVYDTIKSATDRGVVVIEAAGNGGEDLERDSYKGKLSRHGKRPRDSGAIMVGAGGPPREGFSDRARLDFSNYGSRVDVQGWGRKVATLDYGDLQKCAGADRHYTGEFSGTSSASPIVAGAAILIEQATKRGNGQPLTPRAVRQLLSDTGTLQTGDVKQNIGPRPDLSRALNALNL
ncbi:MAG TPA: S8 family peptidase [Kofleriaceae bacterium]|jgi:subtilisin family serine protease